MDVVSDGRDPATFHLRNISGAARHYRKAAGRNDNALVGHQGNSIAFLAGCVHANHLVSIGNQADAGGIHHDLHAFTAFQRIPECLDIARAVRGLRAMGARIERAAAQRHEIVEFHSHALQPFKRRVRAGRQLLDQIQIADLVAAVPRLECKTSSRCQTGFCSVFL